MDPMITHGLDGTQQARYIVRWLWKHGFDDYSHTRWDATSTIRCETLIKYGFDNYSLPD